MKLIVPFIIAFFSLITSCTRPDFCYPESKQWAHRANDTTVAKEKSKCFDGLEIDVYYSEYQNKIFVGHNIEDTINDLQLCKWFDAIESPAKKYFWIDFKNLNTKNADKAADIICSIMESKGMDDNLFVESYDIKALKKIKRYGLRVIFWTENLQWHNVDTATWITDTKRMIDELAPDAISNESSMFGLLTDYFPEQNIHLWETPDEQKDENCKRIKEYCKNKSVKVVLVDNDEPIAY